MPGNGRHDLPSHDEADTIRSFRAAAQRSLHATPRLALADVSTFSSAAAAHSGPSDFDLDAATGQRLAPAPAADTLRSAAVLVPIIARAEPTVLLTQRSAHLPSHAGQIAFPGGKIDGGETPLEAALREAHEEVGLSAHFVDPLGYLDTYRTRTGFAIVPVVAIVRTGFELRLEAGEVDDAFEVPLAFLLDPANHQRHSRELQGTTRSFYAMPYEARYIWGATAGIIKNLHDRIANS